MELVPTAVAAVAAVAAYPALLPQAEAELVFGCGWFDSSLDLAEGLQVIEHAGADWLAEVPLGAVLQ